MSDLEIPRRIQIFKNLRHGQMLYSNTHCQNNGKDPLRVRVTGKVQTWKTRPEEFKVPVKHGLRDSGYITHLNHMHWELDEDVARQKLGLK